MATRPAEHFLSQHGGALWLYGCEREGHSKSCHLDPLSHKVLHVSHVYSNPDIFRVLPRGAVGVNTKVCSLSFINLMFDYSRKNLQKNMQSRCVDDCADVKEHVCTFPTLTLSLQE